MPVALLNEIEAEAALSVAAMVWLPLFGVEPDHSSDAVTGKPGQRSEVVTGAAEAAPARRVGAVEVGEVALADERVLEADARLDAEVRVFRPAIRGPGPHNDGQVEPDLFREVARGGVVRAAAGLGDEIDDKGAFLLVAAHPRDGLDQVLRVLVMTRVPHRLLDDDGRGRVRHGRRRRQRQDHA